jgi:tetratricopeptide (TPR) repeat protein
MRRLLGKLWLLLRRAVVRPAVLLGGLVLLAALGVAGPYLWGWYHWSRAGSELARYHGAEARQHLDVCLWLWPHSPAVHLLAARAARRIGDYQAAEKHLRQCQSDQAPVSAEMLLEWAMLHVCTGDLQEHEQYLQSQLRKDPSRGPLVWEALAEGYLRMYRILDAVRCLDRWLEVEPDNVQAFFLRGSVYRQVQAVQKAVPDFRRVVELDPGRDDAREYLASGLLDTGHCTEALPHLERLLRQRPGDPDLRVRLARCHDGLEHPDQARELLDAVLAEHPDYGPALRTRGQMARQARQPEEAEKWLRRAARVMPYDYQVQYALYEALKDQGKGDDAREQLARAQQVKDRRERLADISHRKMSERPYDPALHCELGTLLIELGHRDLGARWLRSALQKDPNYQPAHAALAGYYEEEGDPEQAAHHRQLADTLPPPPAAKP